MKKIIITILAAICALCCAFGLAACLNDGGNGGTNKNFSFTLNADGESYSVSSNKNSGPPQGDIVIPAEYKNKPVTRIEEHGFSGNPNLTSVVIPDSVTEIDARSFNDCPHLRSINIPNGVKVINDNTFDDCYDLTDISIPDGVTAIGNRAFYNCGSLSKLVIPDSVITIGDEAFFRCSAQTIIIGSSVTTIGVDTFACCYLVTSLEIPDSVTTICERAFMQCERLKTLKIGKGVKSIDMSSFMGCPIETAEAPAMACKYIALGDRDNNIPLKTVVITCGDELEESAFNACNNLTSVTIPDTMTKIGPNSFQSCSSLKSIKIPDSVTSIGENAFLNTNLESAEIPAFACKFVNKRSLKSLVITSGSEISKGVLSMCTALESVTISDSVKTIGEEAFYKNVKLNYVSYTGDLEGWCKIDGLSNLMNSNEKTLVIGGKGIKDVLVLPEGVTEIKDHTFAGCRSFSDVIMSSSVNKVNFYAFWGCSVARVFHKVDSTEILAPELNNALNYYYSEEEPNGNVSGSRYWHYDTDGVTPMVWPDNF